MSVQQNIRLLLRQYWGVIILVCLFLLTPPVLAEDTADSLNESAYQLIIKGQSAKAYPLVLEAIEKAREEDNQTALARAISNQGSIMFSLGRMDEALHAYQQSLEIARRLNDFDAIDRATNNLSNVYNALEEYDQALSLRMQLLEKSLAEGTPKHQLSLYISIARNLSLANRYEEGEKYLLDASRLLKQHPSPFLEIFWLKEKASYAMEKQLLEPALVFLKQAIQIAKQIDNPFQLASLRVTLAEYELTAGHYASAQSSATHCLENQELVKMELIRLDCLSIASQAWQKLGNFEKAFTYLRQYQTLKDKIDSVKVNQAAKIAAIEMRVRETELKLSETEKQKQAIALDLAEQQRMFWALLVGSLILLLLVLFWFYRRNALRKLQLQKAQNQELRELDKLKDRILTNTSHELRTPLNGIIGLAESILITEPLEDKAELKKSIQLIKSSGEQLSEIVTDILDLASLKAHKIKFRFEPFDLIPLIDEVVALLKPLTEKKPVTLDWQPPSHPLSLIGDQMRTRQVLINLIGNAIKFTDKGEVKIRCRMQAAECIMTIRDTGIGIPEDKIERVFLGFEQVDGGNSRRHFGSGLGLAICKEIVESQGGRITLTSRLGEGTEVEVRLPEKPIHPRNGAN